MAQCERCGWRGNDDQVYTCETCGRSVCDACLRLPQFWCLTCYREDEMLKIVQWVAALDPVSEEGRKLSGLPGWLRDDAMAARARAVLKIH